MFDAGATGSAFFLRYRARNYGICTLHQFGSGSFIYPAEAFFLGIADDGLTKIGIPPNEAIRATFEDKAHANLSDFYLARFDDERDGRNMKQHFLQVDFQNTLRNLNPAQIKLIAAIGFPTEAMEVDLKLDEDAIPTGADMKLRWVRVVMERASPSSIDTPNRLPLTIHPQEEHKIDDPDGMSGAPVFFIYQDSAWQMHLGFAGIITHSNGHRYMVYEADIIRQMLDKHIDEEDRTLL